MKKPELPSEGFVRLSTVLKIIPVSKSTWFRGIESGKFPRSIKIGERASAWRVEDIRACIQKMS